MSQLKTYLTTASAAKSGQVAPAIGRTPARGVVQRASRAAPAKVPTAAAAVHHNLTADGAAAIVVPSGGSLAQASLEFVAPGGAYSASSGGRVAGFIHADGTGVQFTAHGGVHLSARVAQREFASLVPVAQRMLSAAGTAAERQATPIESTPAPLAASSAHGLPPQLKAGVEALSGIAMDDVRVHYNSSRPAQLHAHAYAQGANIYLGPGQERHLPHEAWHVVQQAQGRVQPTMQLQGIAVNDDTALEREADIRSRTALTLSPIAVGRYSPPGVASDRSEIAEHDTTRGRVSAVPASPTTAQRILHIGDTTWKKDSNHSERRSLLTEIDTRIKQLGFKTAVNVFRFVNAQIDDTVQQYVFADVDALVDVLFQHKLLYRPTLGARLGPTNLDKRPTFTGDANRIAIGAGQARRHVISSSTLGKAIETAIDSEANADQAFRVVCEFLRRNGVEIPAGSNKYSVGRLAWQLVHNHVGNLWVGPSVPNSARGFIRSTFLNLTQFAQEKLKLPIKKRFVSIQELMREAKIPRGPGMQSMMAQQSWDAIVNEFDAVLKANTNSDDLVYAGVLEQLAEEFQANADLDLPQQADGSLAGSDDYLTRITEIFLALTQSPSLKIFEPKGALDAFLACDTGEKAKLDASAVGSKRGR